MSRDWLQDVKRAGVFQLVGDAREFSSEAASAGMLVYRVDIDHAHGKKDFLARVSKAMNFPVHFGGNWDAFADCMKDLSWTEAGSQGPAPSHARGWVLVLEKSKHFAAGHKAEFAEAMAVLAEAADFWRGHARPLWTLIGGPDGWQSGWPAMPAA